jgi:Tol biopolymer transport system component
MKPTYVNRTVTIACAMIPLAAGAQKPVLREVASLPGVEVWDFAPMPNGRVVYYITNDTLYAYDVTAKKASFVGRGEFDDFSVSRQGDRIVFDRENEDATASHIWTLPVDPATGLARGTAQRVSMSPGHEPRFSPDGRMIAFVVGTASQSHDLAIVPVSGGPERVVAHYDLRLSYVDWTADGKHLYTHLPATAGAGSVIQRVAIDGGKPESLFSVPAVEGTRAAFDGTFTLYWPDRRAQRTGRTRYRGPNGEQGEFDLPAESWSRIDPVGGVMKRYVVATTAPSRVFTVNTTTGATKPVVMDGEQSRGAAFSPDGKKLAVQTSTKGHFEFTVDNLDGSGQRHYPMAYEPDAPLAWWSPDSRRLAFQADLGSKLVVLDVESGATKVLHETTGHISAFVWRESGDALRFWQFDQTGSRTVYEVTVAGALKRLRDLPADLQRRGMFRSEGLIEYSNGAGEYVISAEGGVPRRLPVEGLPLNGVPSAYGDWWVFLLSANAGRPGRVQVVNARGDSSHVIDLPFQAFRSPLPLDAIAPKNRSLLIVGRPIEAKGYMLYSVLFDGSAPREIGTLSNTEAVRHLVLAPDGRAAAYTVEGAPTATIFELDLSPLKRQASKP